MADGAALRHDLIQRRTLDSGGLGQLIVQHAREDIGEIHAGAVMAVMADMRQHQTMRAVSRRILAHRLVQRRPHRAMHGRQLGPAGGGVHHVDRHAPVQQGVTTITKAETPRRPAMILAPRQRAVLLRQRIETFARGGIVKPRRQGDGVRAEVAHLQEHVPESCLEVERCPGARQVVTELGFRRIRQPQHGVGDARLRRRADRRQAAGEIGEQVAAMFFPGRNRMHAQARAGDHAQRAFRSQHHLLQVRPRRARAARNQQAVRCRQPHPRQPFPGAAIARRFLACAVMGDPAAQRGKFKRAREMPQHQSMRRQLPFQFRPADAGLRVCQAGLGIHGRDMRHGRHVQRQDRGVRSAQRRDAAHKAGAAAKGHHRNVQLRAQPQNGQHRVLVARIQHGIGCMGQIARAQLQQIGQAAPGGMARARGIIQPHVAKGLQHLPHRARQPRRGQGDVFQGARCRRQQRRHAQGCSQPAPLAFGQRIVARPPAIPPDLVAVKTHALT